MPEPTSPPPSSQAADPAYQRLVQQVADRVWKLWQQELRQERERGPHPPTSQRK